MCPRRASLTVRGGPPPRPGSGSLRKSFEIQRRMGAGCYYTADPQVFSPPLRHIYPHTEKGLCRLRARFRIELASLLQTWQTERATGALALESQSGHPASLYFLFGHLFHGGQSVRQGEGRRPPGLELARRELPLPTPAKLPPEETIKSSPAELIAEADRRAPAEQAGWGGVPATTNRRTTRVPATQSRPAPGTSTRGWTAPEQPPVGSDSQAAAGLFSLGRPAPRPVAPEPVYTAPPRTSRPRRHGPAKRRTTAPRHRLPLTPSTDRALRRSRVGSGACTRTGTRSRSLSGCSPRSGSGACSAPARHPVPAPARRSQLQRFSPSRSSAPPRLGPSTSSIRSLLAGAQYEGLKSAFIDFPQAAPVPPW